MVPIPIELVRELLIPNIVSFALYGIAGLMLFMLSKQKHSRGLLFMSSGFFIYTIIQIAWTAVYWSVGGPYYITNLIQGGLSYSQAAAATELLNWTGTGIWLGSVAILVLLTIYGATRITRNESTKSLLNFQDNPIDAPVAGNTMKSETT